VAGVAMGLVMDGERFKVLSDIAGAEDHHGDMDFKVAGTSGGITALQMDIKIAGVTREVMEKALAQAKDARMHILGKMAEAMPGHREAISRYAPRIITITINKDKIREIIGPGGKMIRSITERTGCKIDIQDDGQIHIASTDEVAAGQAVQIIKELTAEAELSKTYVGKVVRVVNFGAFVEILPGVEGLLHISEIANERIGEVRDVLDEGDETLVKVIDIDAQGRVRLSRRAAMNEKDGGGKDGGDKGGGGESGGGRGGPPRRSNDDRPRQGDGPGGRPRREPVGVGDKGRQDRGPGRPADGDRGGNRGDGDRGGDRGSGSS
jgi:polyribonucleotide nucleotidyltransferase